MSDSHPEACVTSHYLIKDREIDVRLDRKPLMASASWCSRHDQWLSSCAYTWQERALLSERQNRELMDALQNMTGLFGEAVTRHQMGKGFTDLHSEAVKSAKVALAKYAEKQVSETERLIETERRLNAEVRCDCGVPGCNKLYDHRK